MILLHALSAIFYLAAMAGFAAGVLTLSTGRLLGASSYVFMVRRQRQKVTKKPGRKPG